MEKMLASFKLKESWTFLFKEKQWALKLLFPVIPMLIFGLLAFLIAIPLFISSYAALGKNSDGLAFFGVVGPLVLLCLCCVGTIYVIISSIINSWYQYEYTQVALEDRESNVIIKQNKMDVVKRAIKLLLVNAIYNIPTSIVIGIMYAALILTGGLGQTTSYSTYSYKSTPNFSALSLLLWCVMLLVILFIVVPYNFYIVQTAKVRLIRTNTFREAFRVRTVLSMAKRNFKRLSLFLGVLAVYIVIYVILNLILSIFGIIPFVGLCLIPFNIILSIAVVYFTMFVYPYMIGKAYKEVK